MRWMLVFCFACSPEMLVEMRAGDGGARVVDGGPVAVVDGGAVVEVDAGSSVVDAGLGDDRGPDAGSVPEARSCTFRAGSFGGGMRELDTDAGGAVLRFEVSGVPDPGSIVNATLRFASHDADHPGEEGVIRLNGVSTFDLPAMSGWDNVDATSSVDVLGALVAGTNVVEFLPGSLARSFFRIGDVEIVTDAHVEECVLAPPPPPPTATVRTMHFAEASFAPRRTWVVPCPPGAPGHEPLRNYAFTASGDEHEETDCDGAYRAGGSRRGTATFTFLDVVPASYRVTIRSRHTENRNPSGALFVVNGEEMRIDERTSSDYEDDVFGVRTLEGTVEVVLDSSREGNSDSVTSVTLTPVGG